MKQLCVFDLDGTLVDSLPDIAAAMTHVLGALGLPAFSLEQYRRKVGDGARTLCARCLPAGAEGRLDELLRAYNARYLAHCAERTTLFPGAAALLRRLDAAGVRAAVISNKPHPQALAVVRAILPDAPLALVLGGREGVSLKPAPDALLEVLGTLAVAPQEALYIGDSPVDIRFGKGAGVETCAVCWGYRDRASLTAEGPDHLVERPEEIAALVGA